MHSDCPKHGHLRDSRDPGPSTLLSTPREARYVLEGSVRKDGQRVRITGQLIDASTGAWYEDACSLAEQVLRKNPELHLGLRSSAASFALGGRPDDAKRAIIRLRERDPQLRISDLKDLLPLRPRDLARYEEGMRLAGLPE